MLLLANHAHMYVCVFITRWDSQPAGLDMLYLEFVI